MIPARTLLWIFSARGRKSEFLFKLPFNRYNCYSINAKRDFEMESRWNIFDISSETLDDSDRIAWNCIHC